MRAEDIGVCAQEAKRRPTFAEIIQVLRKLFGEEARRNPATGSSEAKIDRVLQASTSGGSGDMSQKAQVGLHAPLTMRSLRAVVGFATQEGQIILDLSLCA